MSDSWVKVIPADPHFLPDADAQERCRQRFALLAPEADSVEIELHDSIAFIDAGGNFESIHCPSCGKELETDWWQDRMDDDYGDGFKLASFETPCCGKQVTLNDLIYEGPQGFSRVAISAMNPNLGELSDGQRRELESAIGCPLRVIYQHI